MAGQLFATNSLGGFLYSNQLSDELRTAVQSASKFRQFCDVKNAAGKRRGQTFTWDVIQDTASRGGTLVETNTMPEGNFTITQGTLTVTEYGQAVPYTDKLESLSQFPVRKPVMTALKNDAKKALDVAPHTQFNSCMLRVVAASSGTSTTAVTLTTNGTATGTNTIALGKGHVKAIVDVMKERNIPAYTGDDYYSIAWPTTYRQLKNDLEGIHQYTTEGFKMIMTGEIGRYENCRFIEQTTIPHGGAADSTTFNAATNTSDAWNTGISDWAFFFGADTVAEGIVVPEEIRARTPGDYGRSKGIAWYYLGGFGLIHANDSGSNLQSRIVKWDSAV